jgi:hypothetical protein
MAILSLAPITAASSALADTEQAIAAEFFQAGTAAFERKDYKAAARSFEEAYRHVPRAEALFNAGLAWVGAGEPARAADAFDASLARGELNPSDTAQARKRLADLEAKLGVIGVDAPAGALASVAHADRTRIPARIHVSAGDYTVTIVGNDGAKADAVAHVTAGTTTHLTVDLPTPVHPAAEPPVAPPAPHPTVEAPLPRATVPDRTWAWVALGGAVVFGGTAIGLGIGALDARNAFVAGGETDAGQHDKAASLQLWTNVALTAAAVAGAVGVVLLAFPPHKAVAGRGRSAELGWVGTRAVLSGNF